MHDAVRNFRSKIFEIRYNLYKYLNSFLIKYLSNVTDGSADGNYKLCNFT